MVSECRGAARPVFVRVVPTRRIRIAFQTNIVLTAYYWKSGNKKVSNIQEPGKIR